MALERGVGLIVLDNFDEIDRLERLIAEDGLADRGPQDVLVRSPRRARRDTREDLNRPGRLQVRLRDGRR